MATLIWRSGLRGPSPAILHQDFLDEHDKRRVLAQHKLREGHERMSLDALAVIYPAPKEKADETAAVNPVKP